MLLAGQYGDLIPVRREIFSAGLDIPWSLLKLLYCTTGTGSLPQEKMPECGVDHPPSPTHPRLELRSS